MVPFPVHFLFSISSNIFDDTSVKIKFEISFFFEVCFQPAWHNPLREIHVIVLKKQDNTVEGDVYSNILIFDLLEVIGNEI